MSTERQKLYRLMVRQLADDGFAQAAQAVSEATLTPMECEGSTAQESLSSLVQRSLNAVAGGSSSAASLSAASASAASAVVRPGVDLSARGSSSVPMMPPHYATKFVAAHHGGPTALACNWDNRLALSGCRDGSVRLLDLDQMLRYNEIRAISNNQVQPRPVLSLYRDHSAAVSCVAFHPRAPVLLSASHDKQVCLHAWSQLGVRRPFATIKEVHGVRGLDVHPLGNHVALATDSRFVKFYDLQTLSGAAVNKKEERASEGAVAVPDSDKNHAAGGVNAVRWAADGRFFVSAGDDGTVKLWDTASCTVALSLQAVEGGAVTSVHVSRNSRYVLAGGVSGAKLYDVAGAGAVLKEYTMPPSGAVTSAPCHAVLAGGSEQYVLVANSGSSRFYCFDTREQTLLSTFQEHRDGITALAANAANDNFLSGSRDGQVRLWSNAVAEV